MQPATDNETSIVGLGEELVTDKRQLQEYPENESQQSVKDNNHQQHSHSFQKCTIETLSSQPRIVTQVARESQIKIGF